MSLPEPLARLIEELQMTRSKQTQAVSGELGVVGLGKTLRVDRFAVLGLFPSRLVC